MAQIDSSLSKITPIETLEQGMTPLKLSEDSMFLQGDLQAVFDALYNMGAIDPVLKLDWEQVTKEMMQNPVLLTETFEEINACRGDRQLLMEKLHRMENRFVNYVALEVAREFCEFQDRKELH